jgi:FAD/FMN-containing dehydrogenase
VSSKVAQYLNEHLQGEVSTNQNVRHRFATDGSVLQIVPNMVVYPRSTSDVRKVARFSWQLAEKGHNLAITTRGGGTDPTGAAIGSDVILNTMAHLNAILEIDQKQRLVRVQPGVTFKALNDALRTYNMQIPSYPASQAYSTIGGAIANNSTGVLSGKYGPTGDWVHQLEVVLSNGDVLQTGRQSKRDVNKKKGQQTFEGEIYRSLDNLITDNDSLLDKLATDARDNSGYNIVDVKRRDGSMDLTPLFVGSQGTLGIISEIIMKAAPLPPAGSLVGALAFQDYDLSLDALDALRKLDPSVLEVIDGRLFKEAADRGKNFPFYKDATDNSGDVAAVIIVEYDNSGEHAKKKIAKQISKMFKDQPAYVVLEHDDIKAAELQEMYVVPALSQFTDDADDSAPRILEGASIPPEQLSSFVKAVAELESKHHVDLPLCGHAGDHVYYTRPLLNFSKVSDRQKVFKLLAEWTNIVASHDGVLISEGGEGRLKAAFAYKDLDDDTKKLYTSVREILDPLDIMNTGVKQGVELKQLATDLRTDYDGTDFAVYGVNE